MHFVNVTMGSQDPHSPCSMKKSCWGGRGGHGGHSRAAVHDNCIFPRAAVSSYNIPRVSIVTCPLVYH